MLPYKSIFFSSDCQYIVEQKNSVFLFGVVSKYNNIIFLRHRKTLLSSFVLETSINTYMLKISELKRR